MGLFGQLHIAVDALRRVPILRQIARWAYAKSFARARSVHIFHGHYSSYAEAQAAIPPSRHTGYDNADSASLYANSMQVDSYDYPALFWLNEAVNEGTRHIIDLGGSVGIKFYAFSKLIRFPDDLRWTVVDVPSVVAAARTLAAKRGGAVGLSFSETLPPFTSTIDLLYLSGTLQYLPDSLSTLLDGCHPKPLRILINTTPLHSSRSFFTLNNIGTAICPYRVQSRQSFLREIEKHGYVVRDSWSNVAKKMAIPFENGWDVENYSGFYLELKL